MASTGGEGKEDSAAKSLEKFDGSDSTEYRKWRRKAELYLQGLPTTVPEKKWGAKIMEHLTGEAEELVEHMPIDQVVSEGGWQQIFKLLDEKYKEPDRDELQRNLKEYFYAAQIREGESYRNFMKAWNTL